MRYVLARYEEMNRDRAYRIYVTDVLKGLSGAEQRYADIFRPEDTRTSEDIIGGIKAKLRSAT